MTSPTDGALQQPQGELEQELPQAQEHEGGPAGCLGQAWGGAREERGSWKSDRAAVNGLQAQQSAWT